MKQKKVNTLDDDDEKAIQIFIKLGMPENLAKTLLFVSQSDGCQSADIEQGTDLRQPEVSVAMQELRRQKWAKKRDLKKKGKGRPVHIYKLATDLSEILNIFEREILKEVEKTEKNLTELKTYGESLTKSNIYATV